MERESQTHQKLSTLEEENIALKKEIQFLNSLYSKSNEKLAKEDTRSLIRFKTIFESSLLGNKIITQDLKMLQINNTLVSMLGFSSKKELIGRKIIEFAHPDYIHHWSQLQENLWTRNIPSFNIETCLIRKDGSVLFCSVTSILFDAEGETLGYTIVEDITERKIIESKLQAAVDDKEDHTNSMIHDLRNPNQSIKLITVVLKGRFEKLNNIPWEDKKEILGWLDMIKETCDKSEQLIKDLLFIGEIESKGLTVNKEATDIQHLLDVQIDALQLLAEEKKIKIVYNQDPAVSYLVPLHADMFARVINNLLANAVKFTGPDGEIQVIVSKAEKKLTIQISDNGIGIPKKIQSGIFQKFTSSRRKGTKGEATSGLGLYIAKQIVELHNGSIWFESEENSGTTFYIEIPT